MARDFFPDGRVTGWRSFLMSRTGAGRIECVCRHPRVDSLGPGRKDWYHDIWASGEIEAECSITGTTECGRTDTSARPEVPCAHQDGPVACGIYAFSTWEGLQSHSRYATRPGHSYTTEIELGGDRLVVEDSYWKGHQLVRAARAKVLRVVTFERDVEKVAPIAERWGVPITLCEYIDDEDENTRPRACPVLLDSRLGDELEAA